MRTFKVILSAAMLVALTFTAAAQRGFDTFYVPRAMSVIAPQQIAGAIGVSNTPVDIRMFQGFVSVVAMGVTNGGGTMTLTLSQAPATNGTWTAISNIALAVTNTINYTNGGAYGTNQVATNNWVLPGTFTTPTASTAGFATSYLLPSQPTNSGAITFPCGGVILAGFNADDIQHYLSAKITTTGAATTNFAGVFLYGHVHGEVGVTP